MAPVKRQKQNKQKINRLCFGNTWKEKHKNAEGKTNKQKTEKQHLTNSQDKGKESRQASISLQS